MAGACLTKPAPTVNSVAATSLSENIRILIPLLPPPVVLQWALSAKAFLLPVFPTLNFQRFLEYDQSEKAVKDRPPVSGWP